MGRLTEFLMQSPGGPPHHAGFSMPMMKDWVPRRIQPWIYVLLAFCFQFSGGVYLGALDPIRGTTGFMLEDVMFLLYAGLAGMAVYFPLLFRMKFRFTNRQLLCTSAIVLGLSNLVIMHSMSMPLLAVVCFISGMAKIQGTFECMSNIQSWITPKRDFGVFFPVLHIVLLTAIEGSGWLAAFVAHHFTWQMMHVTVVALMCIVLAVQMVFCRPFCPMPQRLSLKGVDVQGALLICILVLSISFIAVYGDYLMWFDSLAVRVLSGVSLIVFGLLLIRLKTCRYPYVELEIFKGRNVVLILLVTLFTEVILGLEHTMESILYSNVTPLEEITKVAQNLWALPGVYSGIALALLWLGHKKWKVWKLFGIGFYCVFLYAVLMYRTVDVNVNIGQYRLPVMLRGMALGILAPTLMWSLQESIRSLEQFFMGLFVFNIIHMFLGGAAGFGIYTTLFSHFLNDDIARYGQYLTLTNLDARTFDLRNFGGFMDGEFIRDMMAVAIKQVYGCAIWFAGLLSLIFLLLDIPAVRTNVRKVPNWPVYAIEYVTRKITLFSR